MVGFTVEKDAFEGLVNRVSKACDTRSGIVILGHIKVAAGDGVVTVTATNLDQTAEGSIPAEVANAGSVCLPSGLLVPSLKKTRGGEVRVMADERRATIFIGKARFQMPVLPTGDFPTMEMISAGGSHDFTVPRPLLQALPKAVGVCASTDITRFYLMGTCWDASPDGLNLVATDGHKLARVRAPVPDGAEGMPKIIVPSALDEMVANLGGDDIGVTVSDSFIRFSGAGLVIASKLVDGTFPDYDRVIPTGCDKSVIFDRGELTEAVRRVSIYTAGERGLLLSVSDGEAALEGWSHDFGEAIDKLSVDGDDEFEIGFAAGNLLAVLSSYSGDTVRLSASDGLSPAIVSDPLDEDRLTVVMPYRTAKRIAEAA